MLGSRKKTNTITVKENDITPEMRASAIDVFYEEGGHRYTSKAVYLPGSIYVKSRFKHARETFPDGVVLTLEDGSSRSTGGPAGECIAGMGAVSPDDFLKRYRINDGTDKGRAITMADLPIYNIRAQTIEGHASIAALDKS